MKKKVCFIAAGIAAFFLVGCTKEVTDYDLTIVDDTNTYVGKYSGTLEDGNAVGEAKYIVKIDDTSNWVYNGNFSEGKFSGEGSVENYPCSVKIGVQNDEGVYSGSVKDIKPDGDGTYTSDQGWIYTGKFVGGVIQGEGKMTDYPYELTYDKAKADGKYSGDVVDGIPNGEGKYVAKSLDIDMEYSGEWSDGAISGKGEIKTNVYTIDFIDISRTGEYEGDVLDGKASGKGKFSAINGYGVNYTYEGDFDKGIFNGYGVLTYDSEDFTDYTGHMTNGESTPTKSELLAYVGTIKDFVSYSVNYDAIKFIDEHDSLFMVDSEDAIESMVNKDLGINELYKTPGEHGDEIIKFSTRKIIQIRQETIFDSVFTWFIVQDKDWNTVFVFCPGELPDINKNDTVTVYGLPINICTYQNAFNANYNAYVIYGAYVKK